MILKIGNVAIIIIFLLEIEFAYYNEMSKFTTAEPKLKTCFVCVFAIHFGRFDLIRH